MAEESGEKFSGARVVKLVVLTVLLVAAAYCFGLVCREMNQKYDTLFSRQGIINLGLHFLLTAGAVAIMAGLVAALLRPVWVAFLAFLLSALVMLLTWELKMGPLILSLIYLTTSLLFVVRVAAELKVRVGFSVGPISQYYSLLFLGLTIAFCGAFYLGYAAQAEEERYSLFQPLIRMVRERVVGMAESEMDASTDVVSLAKESLLAEIERRFDETVDEVIKPYKRLALLVISLGLFFTLETVVGLLSWIPSLLLTVIFPLLTLVGVTKEITETKEVKRLVL